MPGMRAIKQARKVVCRRETPENMRNGGRKGNEKRLWRGGKRPCDIYVSV